MTLDGSLRIKLYYAFVVGFCLLGILVWLLQRASFIEHIIKLLAIILFVIAFLDIMFLIHTATMIVRFSSESDIREQQRFDGEKKRFGSLCSKNAFRI